MKRQSPNRFFVAFAVGTILILLSFVIIEWTRPRAGSIVIPAGRTYLGPNSQ